MKKRDVLFEILCEELPGTYIAPAVRQLAEAAAAELAQRRLAYAGLDVQATPRRLALTITGLAERQPDETRDVFGPRREAALGPDGALTAAGEGFLRKLGLGREALAWQDDRLWARIENPGRPAAEILAEVLPALIRKISFPKTMRWEASGARFARPIRGLVALYGEELIPFTYADVATGRDVALHPMLPVRRQALRGAHDYPRVLSRGRVILSSSARRKQLLEDLTGEAVRNGGHLVPDEELLDVVAMMTEYPAVLAGRMSPSFLAMPREIITTAMREHQRFFAAEDSGGGLLPVFFAVFDNPLARPESIRPGCEQVLAARLQDAEFFYQEDLKTPLADRVPELRRVLWIKGLGSLYDKTLRLERLAAWLSGRLEPGWEQNVQEAAHLAKADLVSHMVQEKEYTSLQGVMGCFYALAQGRPEPVARALREQYQPRGVGDALPASPAGRMLALADKLDHLAGCWGAGLLPTGAKDPYALRRAAQGVVAILLEGGYRLSLTAALEQAVSGYEAFKDRGAGIVSELKKFILGRMESELANRNFPPDLIQALLAVYVDDLTALRRKAETLTRLRVQPEFLDRITAFSRVVNILPKALPRDLPPETPDAPVATELLAAGTEQELYQALLRLEPEVRDLAAGGDFTGMFDRLAGLVPVINRFFDDVLVMDPDEALRTNRLNLLGRLARLIWSLADFSRLVNAA